MGGRPNTAEATPYAQRKAIIQAAQACASLSLLGSTVIVVAYFRFKQVGVPLLFEWVTFHNLCDSWLIFSIDHLVGRVAGLPGASLEVARDSRCQWSISSSLILSTVRPA